MFEGKRGNKEDYLSACPTQMRTTARGTNPYLNFVKEDDLKGVFFTVTNASAAKWCQALEKFKDNKYLKTKTATANFKIQVVNPEAKNKILEYLAHKRDTLNVDKFKEEMGFSLPDSFINDQGYPSEEVLVELLESDSWKFDKDSTSRYMYPQKFYVGDKIVWTGETWEDARDSDLIMYNGRKLTLKNWDDDFNWVQFEETKDKQYKFQTKTYDDASVKIG
jgi:hypothetical protein